VCICRYTNLQLVIKNIITFIKLYAIVLHYTLLSCADITCVLEVGETPAPAKIASMHLAQQAAKRLTRGRLVFLLLPSGGAVWLRVLCSPPPISRAASVFSSPKYFLTGEANFKLGHVTEKLRGQEFNSLTSLYS